MYEWIGLFIIYSYRVTYEHLSGEALIVLIFQNSALPHQIC